jgi:hypothetical protein
MDPDSGVPRGGLIHPACMPDCLYKLFPLIQLQITHSSEKQNNNNNIKNECYIENTNEHESLYRLFGLIMFVYYIFIL